MSKTPIERAARALCSLDGHPENATMDGKPLWQDYLPEVRAVLAAIREPSEGMVMGADDIGSSDPRLHWQAMIDAMLERE